MNFKKVSALVAGSSMVLALALSFNVTAKAPAYVKNGKITVAHEDEPESLDPSQVRYNQSLRVIDHVMEGLTRIDKNNKPMAGIATKWTHSADSKTWTFDLRKNAKWSDGTPVTAKDFVFAWRRMVDPKTAAPYASNFYYLENGEKINTSKGNVDTSTLGVTAQGDYKLVVKLAKPVTFFDSLVSFGAYVPINQKFFEKNEKNFAKEPKYLLYNGPFVLSQWSHGTKLVLKKNPTYWNASQIKLGTINMMITKDSNVVLQKFLAKEFDMAGLKGTQTATVKAQGYKINHYNDGATFYIEFNTKDAIMKNKNIRKALSFSIDRESFCKNVLKNDSMPATGYVTPAVSGVSKSFRDASGDLIEEAKNVKLAKDYLKKGLSELGLKDLPKIEFMTSDSDVGKENAQALQGMWKKNLDLDVQVKICDTNTMNDKQLKGDFQMDLSGWGPDYDEAMTFMDVFETGNGNNNTSYSNPEYDKLIKQAKESGSAATREGLMIKAEKLLMEDMPIAPVYFRVRDYVVHDRLKGVIRRALSPDPDYYYAYVAR